MVSAWFCLLRVWSTLYALCVVSQGSCRLGLLVMVLCSHMSDMIRLQIDLERLGSGWRDDFA